MSTHSLDYENPRDSHGRPHCLNCGSDLVVEGTLINSMKFKPKKLRKLFSWRNLNPVADVKAVVCTICGTVTLRIDPTAVIKLAGDPAEKKSLE